MAGPGPSFFASLASELEQSPEWRRFYPRVYENVGAYKPKVLATSLYFSAISALERRQRASDFESVHYPISCLSVSHGVPQYFVGRELAASLVKTDIPDEVDLNSLAWPFPAVSFHLPPGIVAHKDEGPLDSVTVALIHRGEYRLAPGYRQIHILDAAPTLAVTTFMRESKDFVAYRSSVPLGKYQTFGEAYAFLNSGQFRVGNYQDDSFVDCQLNDPFMQTTLEDSEFNLETFKLGLNLLMTLEHEPGLLESGRQVKVVKAKRPGEPAKEFWTPNFLGRHYRVARECQGGTHASPRIHWRRGHWRQVRLGPMSVPKNERPTSRRRIAAVLVNA